MIPYSDAWIDEDDIQEVMAMLKTGYVSTSPKVAEFEKKTADYLGIKYAVAISNGTAALHACTFALDIGVGDEVITSPMTFAASSNSVLYVGGTPVFADIDKKTYNIDPKEIEKKITKKTKAIIPVHYTGQPADMDAITQIAQKHDLFVIEDAAQALGAKYKGKLAGTLSDVATFSFHAVKNITTFEGGMIVTNDEKIYEKVKLFRTHGITRDPKLMGQKISPDEMWFGDQVFLGYNYRMTDMQASLGVSQLKKIDKFFKIRLNYVKKYNEAFKKLDFVEIPSQLPNTDSAWHLYVLKFDQKKLGLNRTQIFHKLREMGVGVWVHYPPVYYHSYYQKLGYKKGICPNAEKLYAGILTIPLFPKMSEKDVEFVIEKIKSLGV